MRWNPLLLDKHIAPAISSFTSASIPDLAGHFPQADYWPVNYFLNATLRAAWPDRYTSARFVRSRKSVSMRGIGVRTGLRGL